MVMAVGRILMSKRCSSRESRFDDINDSIDINILVIHPTGAGANDVIMQTIVMVTKL